MEKTAVDIRLTENTDTAIFGRLLLAACLCVAVVRLVYLESINLQPTGKVFDFTDTVFSLTASGILVLLFVVWFVAAIWSRRFQYRPAAMELGVGVFLTAAVIAITAASNKRLAINTAVTTIAPMLTAIVLVQILSTRFRIRLLFRLITILAVISALYSATQLFFSNNILITQYENNPGSVLNSIGITANSFQHMLFEHSLYSRDVRSFFITGNSAGSFALLSLFLAAALFIEDFKNFKTGSVKLRRLLVSGVIIAACLFGLIASKSKGAMAATIISLLMFFLCFQFYDWLKKHKKIVLLACLLLMLLVAAGIVLYGLHHGTLPGGISMFVRWQYWQASIEMFADHPLTGVGPGNFAGYYPAYKTAAAVETIADPHNFLLSILAQYGPAGLIGFLLAACVPLANGIFNRPSTSGNSKDRFDDASLLLVCFAIVGFLIHNCIDFAIFEPGLAMVFWMIIASLVALGNQRSERSFPIVKPGILTRAMVTTAALLIIIAYLNYIFIPPVKAALKIKLAGQYTTQPHTLLAQAAEDDKLDPAALTINGRLYMHQYNQKNSRQIQLLENVADCFTGAIARDEADYKNYEKLSITCNMLADVADPKQKTNWRNKAFDSALAAIKRYPGCARLRITAAKTAEHLNKTTTAIEHYKKAIEIEDAYRTQFKKMYPGKKVFSRLGKENYNSAKNKLKQLPQ